MSGSETKPAGAPSIPGKEALRPPLPRRFYKEVSVAPSENGFAVLLDGKSVRTPRKLPLTVPTQALAEALAQEWAAQKEHIDPETMPLSKLAITALDAVAERKSEVAADIVKFAGSDLLCYRAEAPEGLQRLQSEVWDPVLRWTEGQLGARFTLAQGVMPVEQSKELLDAFAAEIAPYDAMALASLHVMTTLLGSAVLMLVHVKGKISAEDTWAAAHLDEDWQISQWGIDLEASDRREKRRAEMLAASRFLSLLKAA
jgi:chaperone required for assembly of F1-ATPase